MIRHKQLFPVGLWAIILLSVLASCERMSQPDTNDGAIRFSSSAVHVGGAQLKSDPEFNIGNIGDADYQIPPPSHESDLIFDGNQISVFGSWSNGTKSSDIFRGVTLTCEETSPSTFEWTYSPLKYWRSDGAYSFGAVSPANAILEFGTSGGKMVASYSMLAHDYDLMVSSTTRAMTGSEHDTDPVNLDFHHVCCAVRFLFKKGDESANYYIDGFELQNLSAVGRLIVEGNDVQWDPAETRSSGIFQWQATVDDNSDNRIEVPTSYISYAHISDTDQTGQRSPTRWHFAIPQLMEGNDGSIPIVQFSINVDNDPTSIITRLELPTEDEDSNPIRWQPNKMYIYTIQIQPSQAYITANVIPWEKYYLAVDDIVF